jgi:hypothetical protein
MHVFNSNSQHYSVQTVPRHLYCTAATKRVTNLLATYSSLSEKGCKVCNTPPVAQSRRSPITHFYMVECKQMPKERDLQANEIEFLLQELGTEFSRRKLKPVRVMFVGGVYMLLIAQSRLITHDIDFFPLNFMDSSQPERDEMSRLVQTAINSVASRYKLKRDWFNDHAFGVIGALKPDDEELRHWKTYGALEIFLPPDEFILMTKIYSYRDKDYGDVQALIERTGITTREQAQALMDKYMSRKMQDECFVADTLDVFFEEE